MSWLTRKPGDTLTPEQMKLVWTKDKDEDILIQEENEQWEHKYEAEEKRPLLRSTGDSSLSRWWAGQHRYQKEVKIGLSLLLILCIFTVEIIFR